MASNRWTYEEDQLITKLAKKGYSSEDIALSIENRSVEAVRSRLRRKGIPTKRKNKPWTESELQRLEEMYLEGQTAQRMSWELGRTLFAVQAQVNRTEEIKEQTRLRKRRPWSPEEDADALKLFKDGVSPKEIAKKAGRTEGAIRARLKSHGCKFKRVGRKGPPSEWTKEETQIAISKFELGQSFDRIALDLKHSIGAVRYKLESLGYSVPKRREKQKEKFYYEKYGVAKDIVQMLYRPWREIDPSYEPWQVSKTRTKIMLNSRES